MFTRDYVSGTLHRQARKTNDPDELRLKVGYVRDSYYSERTSNTVLLLLHFNVSMLTSRRAWSRAEVYRGVQQSSLVYGGGGWLVGR